MRLRGAAWAVLALLCGAAPAAAAPSQAQYDAWSREYGERYDRWYFALLFDRDLYFHDGGDETGRTTRNLVDAHYSVALRPFGAGWAFAVEMLCPERQGTSPVDPNACRPVLRMVSPRPDGSPRPAWLGDFLPRSREDLARVLGATFAWREADLRRCPAALAQLIAFPKVAAALWPPAYLDWLKGGEVTPSDSLSVTADGDGVVLRARAESDPASAWSPSGAASYYARQANRGDAYDWAKAMQAAVEPCLVPSTAPAPWDKALTLPDSATLRFDGD